MASNEVVVKLEGWAEGLWAMRHALANVLRAEAEADADPRVARKLRDIAARFEAGQ